MPEEKPKKTETGGPFAQVMGVKDQMDGLASTAKGIAAGDLSPLEAVKLPEMLGSAKDALGGLLGGKPSAKAGEAEAALGKATGAAGALKTEIAGKIAEKLGAPVDLDGLVSAKDMLLGLGKMTAPPKEMIGKLGMPDLQKQVAGATGKVGDMKKMPPDAAKLQKGIPDVQASIADAQKKLPDMAKKIEDPAAAITGLSDKLKDVTKLVDPLIKAGPIAEGLKKAGTQKQVQDHLAAATKKLPQAGDLLKQATAKMTEAAAPLAEAAGTLAKVPPIKVEPPKPPKPDAAIKKMQGQIGDVEKKAKAAGAPPKAAAENVPKAQAQVAQAQAKIASVSAATPPKEVNKAFTEVAAAVKTANEQLAGPAAGMAATVEAAKPLQEELQVIDQAGAAFLPGAEAGAAPENRADSAALLAEAQQKLAEAPGQLQAAMPAVQQLEEKLPATAAPLAEAAAAMDQAVEPALAALSQVEKELREALAAFESLGKQLEVDGAAMVEAEKKMKTALALAGENSAPADLMKAIAEVEQALPKSDYQWLADFEKRLPELEGLLQEAEGASGPGADALRKTNTVAKLKEQLAKLKPQVLDASKIVQGLKDKISAVADPVARVKQLLEAAEKGEAPPLDPVEEDLAALQHELEAIGLELPEVTVSVDEVSGSLVTAEVDLKDV